MPNDVAWRFDITSVLVYMDVSKNRGTPKSSILIGFSIINHPFWDTTIFGNTYTSIDSDDAAVDDLVDL